MSTGPVTAVPTVPGSTGPADATPALQVRGWHAGLLLLIAVLLLAMAWAVPWLPTRNGEEWAELRWLLAVDEPRSAVHWFTSACYAAAAVGCWAAAGTVGAGGRVGGVRRWRPTAWVTCGLVLVWVWLDHVAGLHTKVPDLPGVPLVGSRPVELAVLMVLLPVGVVLLAGATSPQRVLLGVAGIAYLTGAVLVDAEVLNLGLSARRTAVGEAAGELFGLICLLRAATLERPQRISADDVVVPR